MIAKQPSQNRSDPMTLRKPRTAPPAKHRKCHEHNPYILTEFQEKSLNAQSPGLGQVGSGALAHRATFNPSLQPLALGSNL
ncbi:MAG TPA: hypothetical protein VMA35_00630 [Candidatus Sulfopaludibacter sp.]|nr:hypothetical protein [Candidatus Sulfopaludibacter sp.]